MTDQGILNTKWKWRLKSQRTEQGQFFWAPTVEIQLVVQTEKLYWNIYINKPLRPKTSCYRCSQSCGVVGGRFWYQVKALFVPESVWIIFCLSRSEIYQNQPLMLGLGHRCGQQKVCQIIQMFRHFLLWRVCRTGCVISSWNGVCRGTILPLSNSTFKSASLLKVYFPFRGMKLIFLRHFRTYGH